MILLIWALFYMAQGNMTLVTMECTFTNNSVSNDGGAIYVEVRIVSNSSAIEILLFNHSLEYVRL